VAGGRADGKVQGKEEETGQATHLVLLEMGEAEVVTNDCDGNEAGDPERRPAPVESHLAGCLQVVLAGIGGGDRRVKRADDPGSGDAART
jgi:hypothetical protein